MKGEHVELNVGNVVLIGTVSAVSIIAGLGVMHYASQRNIPFVSRAARGTTDFINATTNKEAA